MDPARDRQVEFATAVAVELDVDSVVLGDIVVDGDVSKASVTEKFVDGTSVEVIMTVDMGFDKERQV